MFRDVPGCSGVFRNVPCSRFYRRPFLQSYVIEPGGRLPETENKGIYIYQISGPKSGRGRLRNLGG